MSAPVIHAIASEQNQLCVNGKLYQRYGHWDRPSTGWVFAGSWQVLANAVWIQTLRLPVPFTPPDGYFFRVYTQETGGFTIIVNAGTTPDADGTMPVRIIQPGSTVSTALGRIGWELVPAT